MKKIFTIIMFAIGVNISINAQTNKFPSTGAAGIGTTTPNPSSLLEIRSTAKGFLMSRMTKTQRDAIVSPATGLMIYQTNSTPGFYYYNGNAWKSVSSAAASGANITLSNLKNPTKINVDLLPASSAALNLGSTLSPWKNIYVSGGITISGITPADTGIISRAQKFGVYGSGFYGVYGRGDGAGIYGGGNTGVRGEGVDYGVYGQGQDYGVYRLAHNYGVFGGGPTYGVYGLANNCGVYGEGNTYGLYGKGDLGVRAEGDKYGVWGSGSTYGVNGLGGAYGVRGSGDYGVYGNGGYGVYGDGGYGVYGKGGDYGVYGTGDKYGIYGTTISADGFGGVFNSEIFHGLYARTGTGNAFAAIFQGSTIAYGTYQTSDKNLKKNIEDVGIAINIIKKLKPKYYEFKDDNRYTLMNLPKGKHYGLLAQDVEEVLPNLVKESIIIIDTSKSLKEKGAAPDTAQNMKETVAVKGVNYTELIPILVKAIQEQQQQIDELKTMTISGNQSTLVPLNAGVNGQQSTVIFSSALQQNIPNPFTNSTTINYTLPQKFASAQIVITDKNGKTLKTVNVSGNGKGNLTVDAAALAAGAYQYSLIIDGKIMATKQMVLAN